MTYIIGELFKKGIAMELIDRVVKAREYKAEVYRELHENPINLDELFDAVTGTIRHQYVGFPHKQQYYTPAEYHTYVFTHFRYQDLTYEMLVRSLHQFIGDLHDRHIKLLCDDWIDYRNLAMKYRVRATEDTLYVTSADPETGLMAGDKILQIQGMTPQKVRKLTRNNCFYSRYPERELWGGYLRMAESLLVEHADGKRETMRMKLFPASEHVLSPSQAYPISFWQIPCKNGSAVCLQLQRMDSEVISNICQKYKDEIAHAALLILDLRRCIGGDEGAGWELFPYLIDKETSLQELLGDEGSYVLCTKENCALRISQLQTYAQQLASLDSGEPADKEALAMIESEIRFYRENMGKGLTFRPADSIDDENITPASEAPARIVVLTDTFCENEGEQFVSMCRRCGKKVTLLGRPTMGTLDYDDNINLQVHPHMTLSYPIRMTKAAHDGRGISEKGIAPDIYIPWTPDEIHRDILLERTLGL